MSRADAARDQVTPTAQPRRLKTRRRITEAAHRCFLERGVAATSVDDIVAAAGISRATFYLHYNNKEAILIDLLREQEEPLKRFYFRLRDLPDATPAAVADWLKDYVGAVQAHRRHLQLFSLGMVYDDEPRRLVVSQRMEFIELLSERYPAFRVVGPDGAQDKRKLVQCLLMMFEIEQVVSALVHGDVMPDEETAIEVLSERLSAFIAS